MLDENKQTLGWLLSLSGVGEKKIVSRRASPYL